MYVGDRDTYNDVFCQECGEIADHETLNETGLCEDCFKEAVRLELVAGMQQTVDEMRTEVQDALDADWQHVTESVHAEEETLPAGDVLLYCEDCKRRTQHTETQPLPGGFPLLVCVICDGGQI